MKRIFAISVCLASALFCLSAQEVSYWVGESEHPDPIMRHHEAFMNAFLEYIQNLPQEHGAISSGTTYLSKSPYTDSCRIETVSSVTHDGREIITISIGIGPLVKYQCITQSSSSKEVMQTNILLNIAYQDESNRSAIESAHEYRKECFTEKGTATSVSHFRYFCTYTSKYE